MRKKVIVFCEGKILHRESNARNSINDLLQSYEVLALVDRQSHGRFFSTSEKNIMVYESINQAFKNSHNIASDLFLLFGYDHNSELLILQKSNHKSVPLKLTVLEPINEAPQIIGYHIQDLESDNSIDNEGHQRDNDKIY